MQYRLFLRAGKQASNDAYNKETPLLTGLLYLCDFVLFEDGHTQCTAIGYDLSAYYKRRLI
jgi:hypothetical protein